jgi:oligopeptide transport system permease protein
MSARDTAPVLDQPRAGQSPLRRFTRSVPGVLGLGFLSLMILGCILTLPWTVGRVPSPSGEDAGAVPRYSAQERSARQIPPSWAPHDAERAARRLEVGRDRARAAGAGESDEAALAHLPVYILGTDALGRDLFVRVLTGGGVSLVIGICAALLSVFVGTVYGGLAGFVGGRVDALLMRIVDVLYGLPYILLVVLLAVAVDAKLDDWQASRAGNVSRARVAWVDQTLAAPPAPEDATLAPAARREAIEARALARFGSGEISQSTVQLISIGTLLFAIGGVSWLTMARVVRGQVLSLKRQPFMEAARAMGASPVRQFARHLLPNLVGPITVYATLTVPQAILQESFLSFLGIGVRPPLPSWGNLAADGLLELNPYRSNWWLLLFPCLLLGATLLSLNFVGEGLREALDPKRARR